VMAIGAESSIPAILKQAGLPPRSPVRSPAR